MGDAAANTASQACAKRKRLTGPAAAVRKSARATNANTAAAQIAARRLANASIPAARFSPPLGTLLCSSDGTAVASATPDLLVGERQYRAASGATPAAAPGK